MPRIFVSYRRADTGAYAGRIADRLKATFGDENVFKDSYNIPPGADFRGAIREEVGKADVVLALIGPDWLDYLDQRRDDPHDWMRLEIETGLQRDSAVVIPLLLDGVPIPPAARLPDSIRELAYKNGFSMRVDDPYFGRDIGNLIEFLRSLDSETPVAPVEPERPAASASPQIGGSGNTQINIGQATNSTVMGNQANYYGGGSPPKEEKPERGCSSTVIVAVIGALATIIAAAIGILPQVLNSAVPTATATNTPTTVMTTQAPSDTPEPPTATSAPSETDMPTSQLTETASSAPSYTPQPIVSATTVSAVSGDSITLTIFRDEDSFTLYVPDGDNVDLRGLAYRVTTNRGEQTYGLEGYASFLGMPYDNLLTPVCFRLIRSGARQPVPLECGSGTQLLTQELASGDVFWYDSSTNNAPLVTVLQNEAALGVCPGRSSRCEVALTAMG